MRKQLLYITLFIGLIILISACKEGEEVISSAPPAATAPPKTNAIRIASRDGAIGRSLERAGQIWTERTGTEVIIDQFSYNYLQEQVFLDVQNDDGTYDVVLIDDPWFPSLAGHNYLVPLSAFDYQIDDDFVQRSIDVAMWPPPFGPRHPFLAEDNVAQLFALPLVGNVQMFWYQNSAATDFTTLSNMIDTLPTTATNNNLYAYAYAGQAGNPIVTEFNAWNWSYGGEIFDEHWNVVIDQEPSVQALTDFIRLANRSKSYNNSLDSSTAVYNNQAAASLIWPTQITSISNNQLNDVTIAAFPPETAQATQLGHWLLGIPITAGSKQEAYNFILWATSAEMMKEAVREGIPPTRTSVFQDPELMVEYPWLPAVEASINNALWRPRTPEWPNIEHVLGNYLSEAVRGELEPQEALALARDEIYALMLQAGYYD